MNERRMLKSNKRVNQQTGALEGGVCCGKIQGRLEDLGFQWEDQVGCPEGQPWARAWRSRGSRLWRLGLTTTGGRGRGQDPRACSVQGTVSGQHREERGAGERWRGTGQGTGDVCLQVLAVAPALGRCRAGEGSRSRSAPAPATSGLMLPCM